MNVLIVHAHPEPRSFNAALTDVAVTSLTGSGHEVGVSDLYAMRFNGIDGALLDVLWPVHNGMLRCTGFDVLPPFAAHMPGKSDETEVLGHGRPLLAAR